MSRFHLTFPCEGDNLAGTLDTAPAASGLLIVTGGNEIRSGAFRGQARLASEIARAGFPVFRYDRRGVGDSEGENRGFRHSAADIRAAFASFRVVAPQVERVVGFGNCDAASALMLAQGAGCDALVLSNPWTIEGPDEGSPTDASALPPAAIRARYLAKLKKPREVLRLVSGGVNYRKLFRGLARAAGPKEQTSSLAVELGNGLDAFSGPVRILLADNDRTAQVFADQWPPGDSRIVSCPNAGHAYVEPDANEWLREQLLAALRG
ncbi:hydrolase 1, exosortase A system-associated [Qipengyuania spongiae]|uniref:Hydrolase 1, exosortase A system-associated n=1 Tax=Qipengyuania spongiae TaxID=2909673 RepID=A0ABY5T0G9_9SPHN|nr:hydrolase 1, exosortase A system-associated [Qipengyuania spongiae]UVI38994.1 hydrolase 1, exosortase A system-associated [Qipengyuania spongiae]